MKTIKIFSIALIIVMILPFFYQCKEKELEKKVNADDYISKESFKKIEKLNGFYTIAISKTKEKLKGKKSSGDAIVSDIESQVVQLCKGEFGNDFNLDYNRLKGIHDSSFGVKQLDRPDSEEPISLSEYALNLNSEMNSAVELLFEGDATPTDNEMNNAITQKLNFYKNRIAIDNNLSESEKSYLINSIAGQLVFLPTTFAIVDIVVQNSIDQTQKSIVAQKGWLKKAWKKVSSFVKTVGDWGLAAYVISGGNPIAGIAGLVVGIGSAIYCENHDYDNCVCSIIVCILKKTNTK